MVPHSSDNDLIRASQNMSFDDTTDEKADQDFEFEREQVDANADEHQDESNESLDLSMAHSLKATKFRNLTHITVLHPRPVHCNV